MEKVNRDFADLYTQARPLLNAGCNARMNALRDTAFEQFRTLGIPNLTEDYKYLDLYPLFNKDYHVTLETTPQMEDIHFHCAVEDFDVFPVYTLNGRYAGYPKDAQIPEGIVICSIREAGEKYPQLFEKHYNTYTSQSTADGLIPLNTAFAQDGVFIYIPDNTVVEKPIQILNLLQSKNDWMGFQRNLVVAGKNSQATVLVCGHTLSNNLLLMNNVTEIYTDENAILEYYQVQNRYLSASQINSLFVSQQQNSTFNSYTITLYGGVIRNNFYVKMGQKGCESNLYGIYTLDKNQKVDNFSFIDHAACECRSNEIFKGILDDVSVANFCGQVRVRPDSQKTESNQLNRNLLLSKTARINSKPQLVIDADDVKCSHGSSVGQMDEEALFYLRSRGIGLEEAKMMMLFGFAHDIISRVKLEPLREKIDELINKRLRGELPKCHHCSMDCKK